ncbi:MAG: flagellar export chaperone FliS, partial [SAR324 cluster bacterium]|nr:flagellar export chaperone FliS [SAR324 cluster bacterium]
MIKGYTRYSQAYKQTAVTTADQGRLIVMLYDGAIKFLNVAIEKLETGDAYGANSNLIKGKSIVAELLASLNMEQGGDIALNLQRLYTYIFNEL